jgi:hypothetical protein
MEALQRLHNRGSISTGYEVEYSLKFETDNTEYLMAEGRGQGNQQTWTYSCWLKRTEVNNGNIAQHIFSAGSDGKLAVYFRDDASYPDDRIFIYIDEGNSLKWIGQVNQSFRDNSAWYHFVFACDSTDSTAADRTKLYINGVQQTITYNSTLNQNVSTRVGDSGGKFAIGGKVGNTSYGFNGYMAECILVDGSALAPTSFGEYDEDSGIWKPKSPPALGTQGFHMNFDNAANLGAVQAGTSQGNFDKYNIAASDQATDTPTNNFCTLGLQVRAGTSNEYARATEGGTFAKVSGTNQFLAFFGTMGVTQGKWYWEFYIPSRSASYGLLDYIGLHSMKTIPSSASATTGTSQCNYVLHYGDYNATVNGSNSGQNTVAGLPSYGTEGAGKTFGVAFDADNGKITFYANNTRIGNANIDIFDLHDDMAEGTFVVPFFQLYDNNLYANFGGCSFWASPSDYSGTDANGYGSFAYSPPSGYYALCTKNLEEFG